VTHRLHRHITGRGSRDYLSFYSDPLNSYPAEVAGNPFPLGAGLVSGITSKVFKQYDPTKHGERQKMIRALGELAVKGANDWHGTSALEHLKAIARGEEGHDTAIYPAIVEYANSVLEGVASQREAKASAAATAAGVSERREERITGAAEGIGTALASAFGRSRQPRRRTTYDRYGRPQRQQYEEESVAGGFPAAGALKKLSGAGGKVASAGLGLGTSVGAASGAAVAAVVIGGLAAGVLLGTLLRKGLGEARAVRNEEAATKAQQALLETRRTLQTQLGRNLTAAENKKLFAALTANLQQLGFTQDDAGRWTRGRSALERFLG
jgi:hypothetical protein